MGILWATLELADQARLWAVVFVFHFRKNLNELLVSAVPFASFLVLGRSEERRVG